MSTCILFTDVKQSSRLWSTHPDEMGKALAVHERIIRSAVQKYKGFVVKTIGDAFMIKFNTLHNAVLCAISIQSTLRNKPLRFSKSSDLLQIRIGIAQGPLQQRYVTIQGHKLKDFFGPTVNIASRMESKVFTVGGFGILADQLPKKIIDLLNAHCNIHRIEFKNTCSKEINRSKRLIASNCYAVEYLHIDDGKEHLAYQCELK